MSVPKPFSFEEFKAIYSKVPRLCADVVIKSDEGYLLTLRKFPGGKEYWYLLGSTVYLNEPPTSTAIRAIKEDLGVDATIKKFLGYINFKSTAKTYGFGHSICLVFECTISDMNFKLGDQNTKIAFFKELPDNIIPEDKEFLENLSKTD